MSEPIATDPAWDEPAPAAPLRLTTRQLADLTGLLLLLAGVALLLWAAYRWDTTAGIAATGAACIGGGLLLGLNRRTI